MGNRGILHDDQRQLGNSRWTHSHWIICLTEFKNRHRQVMAPRHYTELFFMDEAVALAAGHRPCAECRRADFNRYVAAVAEASGQPPARASVLDRQLHAERVHRNRRQKTHSLRLSEIPDGAMVHCPARTSDIRLRQANKLLLWRTEGYIDDGTTISDTGNRESGNKKIDADQVIEVLTPPVSVLALRAGYRPVIYPGARHG